MASLIKTIYWRLLDAFWYKRYNLNKTEEAGRYYPSLNLD